MLSAVHKKLVVLFVITLILN
uniref:Uncharacterized protein n=1 Tax=Anopheles minimus TaxID=112268 RepID=A0A182VW50_9DIPT